MLTGIGISLVVGFVLGAVLGRFARIGAALCFLAGVGPMVLLFVYESLFPKTDSSSFGLFSMLALLLVTPAAIAMFATTWFRD